MLKRLITFCKRDFMSVRLALDSLFGKRVSLWIIIPYYAIMAPIGFALYLVFAIWRIWYYKRLGIDLKKAQREAEEFYKEYMICTNDEAK